MKIIKEEITWRDSRRYVLQMEVDAEFSFCEITTVGYLVDETKKQVVLCQDWIEGDVRGVIVIPKENIIRRKKLT